MTLNEAIDRVDMEKPNTYSIEDKVRWLAYIDGIIKTETIDCHRDEPEDTLIVFPIEEEPEPEVNTRYTTDDLDNSLLAPYPYDELYIAFLKLKIDEGNGETTRYNNSVTIFNSLHEDYLKAYNKQHMPIPKYMRLR